MTKVGAREGKQCSMKDPYPLSEADIEYEVLRAVSYYRAVIRAIEL